MNGNMKLLLGLGYVSGEYIDTALEAMPVMARRARRHRPVRALLAAAVIVSLLLGLGAAAYAGNWFGIKDALLRQTEETVYLSIQGLESSAEFQAYQEFIAFYEDYTANGYYGDAVPQEQDEWMREHSRIYFCYTQRLKDKIFELCGKYGLKTRDGVYEEGSADIRRLYTAIGIDGFIRGSDFDNENVGFICYGDGSFVLQGMWYGTEKGLDCTVRRSMKGYFGQGYAHFDAGAVTEQSYTTALGTEVTIIMDEYNGAVLYVSNGDAFFNKREEVFGASVISSEDTYDSGTFTFNGSVIPYERYCKVGIEPTTAQVLANDGNGKPIFTVNNFGKGKIYYLNFPLEDMLSRQNHAFDGGAYKIYEYVLKELLEKKTVRKLNSKVGVTENGSIATVINYSNEPVKTGLYLQNGKRIGHIFRGNPDYLEPCDGAVFEII